MEVGQKYKLFFNTQNINNGDIEIRAVVDGLFCVYIKNGQYRMDYIELFKSYIDEGYMTPAKQGDIYGKAVQ